MTSASATNEALKIAESVSFNPLEAAQDLLSEDLDAVNRLILERLHSDVVLVNQVGHHIIQSGGKRLRPLMVLLAARAFGYGGTHHRDMAAIVEFIHTATLLHDDVVDASSLRRGNPTANAVFGNEASVLVGDFLYSRAFQMMVAVGDMRTMQIMADTTNVIAEGEVLQLLNCGDPETTEGQYLAVIRSKTAKLFEAACQVGAVLAQTSRVDEEAIARYGLHVGTAFQLIDDVLDYRGSSDEIGKNLGDDLAEGKPTLPLIYVIKNGDERQQALARNAIRNGGLDNVEAVLSAVESTGAITYTARAAAAEAKLAIEAIEGLPTSPYRDALEGLAEFAVSRTH